MKRFLFDKKSSYHSKCCYVVLFERNLPWDSCVSGEKDDDVITGLLESAVLSTWSVEETKVKRCCYLDIRIDNKCEYMNVCSILIVSTKLS